VGRRGDVDDVDVGPLQDLAEVRVAVDPRRRSRGPSRGGAVHVAHRPQDGPGVGEVAPAHAADPDHRLGQRVARRRVARPAEDVARDDGEGRGPAGAAGAVVALRGEARADGRAGRLSTGPASGRPSPCTTARCTSCWCARSCAACPPRSAPPHPRPRLRHRGRGRRLGARVRARARLEGVDRSGWAVAEARWTWGRLGLEGRRTRGDAATAPLPKPPAGVLAAFTVNELAEEPRRQLLSRLVAAAGRGRPSSSSSPSRAG
jgi:hypothetical protein